MPRAVSAAAPASTMLPQLAADDFRCYRVHSRHASRLRDTEGRVSTHAASREQQRADSLVSWAKGFTAVTAED